MKQTFRCLKHISILFVVISGLGSVFGQSANQTTIAKFSIDEQDFSVIREGEDSELENTFVVKLNDKRVVVINTWRLSIEGYFDLVDLHKVVILSTTPSGMGNACPKNLVLVSFNDNGVSLYQRNSATVMKHQLSLSLAAIILRLIFRLELTQ